MSFVLDASITACWAFGDESHPDADSALMRIRTEEVTALWLWWFEVRNILVVNERRGRITSADIAAFLDQLSRFRVRLDDAPEESRLMHMARSHRLSVYDAAYLEVALREGIALATLDEDLRKAASRENVTLVL